MLSTYTFSQCLTPFFLFFVRNPVQQGELLIAECLMAKLKATELANRVVDECLQFYGGYGYLEKSSIARMYRDTRVRTIAGGTSEIMREIIALFND